ncbi:hypothetical protein [Rufibacter sp. LB8]|uniref:hypothetical protein n=1 Tax=Rufibacter sp. LB8 TaxID=2777781 RepID=UPI00178C747F|nr:hypothetical protein [Rufibacter sp. LB8]
MKPVNSYDKITLGLNKALDFNHQYDCKKTYSNTGELLQLSHQQVGMSITIDYQRSFTRITLSSKFLKAKALGLITLDTFSDMYREVSKVVSISSAELEESIFQKGEVTQDVTVDSPSDAIGYLYTLAKKQMAYKIPKRCYKHGGKECSFYMKKNNLSRKYIDYLSIYDKEVEQLNPEIKANQAYLNSLSSEDRHRFQQALKGKVRFEVKFNSAHMVRHHLKLTKDVRPTFKAVLDSEVPVVANMVQKVFKDTEPNHQEQYKPKNMNQLSYYLALKENKFDLNQTREYLRTQFGDVKLSRIMKKVAEVLVSATLIPNETCSTAYQTILKLLTHQ